MRYAILQSPRCIRRGAGGEDAFPEHAGLIALVIARCVETVAVDGEGPLFLPDVSGLEKENRCRVVRIALRRDRDTVGVDPDAKLDRWRVHEPAVRCGQ